jgi:hypothetical protein
MLSGFLANLFNAAWRPTTSFGMAGVLPLLMVAWLVVRFKREELK